MGFRKPKRVLMSTSIPTWDEAMKEHEEMHKHGREHPDSKGWYWDANNLVWDDKIPAPLLPKGIGRVCTCGGSSVYKTEDQWAHSKNCDYGKDTE